MSQGCFEVNTNPNNQFDIQINIIPTYAINEIPEDQKNLYVEIEKTISILESLYATNEIIKQKYFLKLFSLSEAGLVGPSAQPNLAQKSLDSLKEEILINEGPRIKSNYMLTLGICALILLVLSFVIMYIFNINNYHFLLKYTYAFMGAMPGTWISFGARKIEFCFEDLSIIEKDKIINPIIRLIFIGLTAIILMLFLDAEVITLSFYSIKNSPQNQILLGVLSGLMESKLAVGLYNKATTLIEL